MLYLFMADKNLEDENTSTTKGRTLLKIKQGNNQEKIPLAQEIMILGFLWNYA